jgi:hypothetical protein
MSERTSDFIMIKVIIIFTMFNSCCWAYIHPSGKPTNKHFHLPHKILLATPMDKRGARNYILPLDCMKV